MSPIAKTRQMALIGPESGERQATHTTGYPLDADKMLPVADVILLISGEDPGAMLHRYTAHGEIAGDTWHGTVAEALEQASDEYRGSLLEWVDVPDNVTDAHAYAVQYALERLKERGGW